MEQESALLSLPADALLAILGLLSPQELLRCASCCRSLYAVSRSDCLWLSLCTPWRHILHLPSWRSCVHSGPELFRILSTFDHLVGPWTAQGHHPRGSLLYIAWGNCCLLACRVLAGRTGELKLEKSFEVFGLRDGSFKVELISKDPNNPFLSGNRISGKLLWDSKKASEFTLQTIKLGDGIGQTTGSLNFSQRALQYLIRMTKPTRHNFSLTGQPIEENMVQGQVVRCSFSRLTVAEPRGDSDLVGLWMGVYGPHGAEIVNVTETEEGILGTKVLGDPNVPCGQVSFRASRGFETTNVPVELQQIVDLQMQTSHQTFTIAKLLEGNGQIAGHNFRNPLWVPGHLLVSTSGRIAFLWEDVNFVIPFERLDLAALYQSHKSMGTSFVDSGEELS